MNGNNWIIQNSKKYNNYKYILLILFVLMILSCSGINAVNTIPSSGNSSQSTKDDDNSLVDRKTVGNIYDVGLTDDGKQIALGCTNGILFLDSNTLRDLQFVKTDTYVTNVVYSPDGKKLTARMNDGSVSVWKADDGKYLFNLQTTDFVTNSNLLYSPNGVYIVGYGSTFELGLGIYIWNANDGSIIETINTDNHDATNLDLSPDGKLIAYGEEDGYFTIWNIDSREIVQRIMVSNTSDQYVAFLPGGKQIAVGNEGFPGIGRITIWDVNTGEKVENVLDHTFREVYYSPDGKLMYFIDQIGLDTWKLNIWDINSNNFLNTEVWGLSAITNMALYPDGTKILLLESEQYLTIHIEIRNTNDGKIINSREIE